MIFMLFNNPANWQLETINLTTLYSNASQIYYGYSEDAHKWEDYDMVYVGF